MSDSYENPQFSETCDLYREIERLKEELSTHRALISRLTQALEEIASMKNLFFAECSDAEKVIQIAQSALQSSRTSHLGERERLRDEVIQAVRKISWDRVGTTYCEESGFFREMSVLGEALHRLDGCREGK